MSFKIHRLCASCYTDTGFINVKSLAQNTCYQGYSAENFIYIDPMRDRTDCADSLMNFVNTVGAPAELVSDHAAMLIGRGSDFAKQCRYYHIKQSACEPDTQKQNDFEGETRLGKLRWKNQTSTNNCPKRVWDYALVYLSLIHI